MMMFPDFQLRKFLIRIATPRLHDNVSFHLRRLKQVEDCLKQVKDVLTCFKQIINLLIILQNESTFDSGSSSLVATFLC